MEILLHSLIQSMILIISLFSLLFYVYQKVNKISHVDWEVIYIVAVEVFIYGCMLTLSENYLTVDGGRVALFRYAAWLTTCPVLLSNIIQLMTGANDFRTMATPLIADLWMNVFGFVGAFFTGTMKVACFVLGCLMGAVLYFTLHNIGNSQQAKGLPFYRERKRLLNFLMITWCLFPLLYLVGPEFLSVITFRQSAIGHAVGDLLAKNLMGYFTWSLGCSVRSDEFEEAADVENNLGKETCLSPGTSIEIVPAVKTSVAVDVNDLEARLRSIENMLTKQQHVGMHAIMDAVSQERQERDSRPSTKWPHQMPEVPHSDSPHRVLEVPHSDSGKEELGQHDAELEMRIRKYLTKKNSLDH